LRAGAGVARCGQNCSLNLWRKKGFDLRVSKVLNAIPKKVLSSMRECSDYI
jgi:hypothetical protein